jgi:hypothetical protein
LIYKRPSEESSITSTGLADLKVKSVLRTEHTHISPGPEQLDLTRHAVNIMVERYNTPERQARVHTYLANLRFRLFRFGEKLDASSTLTALTSEISKLAPMGPPQYQGEIHAVEHLHNAVLGET